MFRAPSALKNDRDHHAVAHEGNHGRSSTSRTMLNRWSTRRNWFFVFLCCISVYLLRIESIVYRELRDGHQRAEEDTLMAKTLREGSTKATENAPIIHHNRAPHETTPVSRNGFLARGALRGPIVASPRQINHGGILTFDHLELARIEYQRSHHPNHSSSKEIKHDVQLPPRGSPFHQRIIALNEELMVTEMEDSNRSSVSKVKRSMVLDEEAEAKDNDDESSSHILDFERPFYDDCDRVLTRMPIVHPTCNSIHELTLTTTQTDSALLSMKGSWRSVWKVSLEPREDEPNSTHTENFTTNETSSLLLTNATTDRNETVLEPPPSSSSVVLKMLHLHREFDRHSYEAHAMDIMVMDQLTASPYVVDAYGFCGQSVVTEFASSTGRDYVKRYDIGSRERMRIARDISRGLADVQALQPLPHAKIIANATEKGDYDETPSIPVVFAHNDINIANTIMVDGAIKWNDFNIGVFMRRQRKEPDVHRASSKGRHHRPPNEKSNLKMEETKIAGNGNITSPSTSLSTFNAFTEENKDRIQNLCPAPVKYRSDMWRSPEEIKNATYVQMTQTDVYGLGNILYQTMTRHQPWTYKEPGGALTKTDIANRKLNGTIPTIPEQYLNTTKRELQTLFAATNLCFFPNPEKRPSARRLAFGLGRLYDRLKHKERVTRVMILDHLVPPDPS